MIIDGDPQSVSYADGVIHSLWVHRTLRSADTVVRGRDPQSVPLSTEGSVEVVIDGDPQSVWYADGVIHSQWIHQTLRFAGSVVRGRGPQSV